MVSIKTKIERMLFDDQGSIIIPFALFLPVFILVMALSIDASKSYVVKSKVSGAQDAATIAAAVVPDKVLAATLYTKEQYAQKYASLNLGDGKYLDSQLEIDFAVTDNSISATSRATKSQNYFAQAASGSDSSASLTVSHETVVNIDSNTSTSQTPTLVAMVHDGSGSMAGGKNRALKVAATTFADITIKDSEGAAIEISQIVYAHVLRWSEGFSSDYDKVIGDVARIGAGGGTCGTCGIERAEKIFQCYLGDTAITDTECESIAAARNTPVEVEKYRSYKKQIIFMTDGRLNRRQEEFQGFCDRLKDSGYEVIGITFGGGADRNRIRNCASTDQYYHAPDSSKLEEIFRAIATKVVRARMHK